MIAWTFLWAGAKVSIIDTEDLAKINKWGWSITTDSETGNQFVRGTKGEFADKRIHRLLLDAQSSVLVDHRNGNQLDNRKCNLRIATQSQNGVNRRPNLFRELPKGVTKHGTRFRARIKVNGKQVCLGVWATVETAEQKYKEGAEKYFGEFATHLSRK